MANNNRNHQMDQLAAMFRQLGEAAAQKAIVHCHTTMSNKEAALAKAYHITDANGVRSKPR